MRVSFQDGYTITVNNMLDNSLIRQIWPLLVFSFYFQTSLLTKDLKRLFCHKNCLSVFSKGSHQGFFAPVKCKEKGTAKNDIFVYM